MLNDVGRLLYGSLLLLDESSGLKSPPTRIPAALYSLLPVVSLLLAIKDACRWRRRYYLQVDHLSRDDLYAPTEIEPLCYSKYFFPQVHPHLLTLS